MDNLSSSPQRIDPSQVHIMTDEEIFQQKVEDCVNSKVSILESLMGATIHINVNDFVKNEADLHKRTASKIFHVPYDDVTPEQREIAKRKNFIKAYSRSHERGAEDPALGDGVDLEV